MPVSPLFSPVTSEKPLKAEERYGVGKRKDREVAGSRGVRARDLSSTSVPLLTHIVPLDMPFNLSEPHSHL